MSPFFEFADEKISPNGLSLFILCFLFTISKTIMYVSPMLCIFDLFSFISVNSSSLPNICLNPMCDFSQVGLAASLELRVSARAVKGDQFRYLIHKFINPSEVTGAISKRKGSFDIKFAVRIVFSIFNFRKRLLIALCSLMQESSSFFDVNTYSV